MKKYRPQLSPEQHRWLIEQLDSFARMATKDVSRFGAFGAMILEIRQVIADAELEDVDDGSAKKVSATSDFIPKFCKTHEKYGAQRPPRTDCEGCWAAYKRFNPNKYDSMRKKFDRKNGTSE
jgi:hypothetical protein